jgi:hypothetical protein
MAQPSLMGNRPVSALQNVFGFGVAPGFQQLSTEMARLY